jgi:DNA-binding NtrC family response regulator
MNLLIIDDDKSVSSSLTNFIKIEFKIEIFNAGNGQDALDIIKNNEIDIVLSDINMPGINGIELISKIKQQKPDKIVDVILMTGYPDMNSVLNALRNGAYDYIKKPINIEELVLILQRAIDHQTLIKENTQFKDNFDHLVKQEEETIRSRWESIQTTQNEFYKMFNIGLFSKEMTDIVNFALKCHQNREIPVLIEGETGSGKEVIAKIVHYGKTNPLSPFVAINCSAVPENLFESELFGYERGAFTGADIKGKAGMMELAKGGTLFLDEIGDLPASMQAKLLRALQEKEIYRIGGNKKIKLDFRLICATNKSLNEMVNDNQFRSDLYYRINTAYIKIPPLSDRKNEIVPLAYLFLKEFSDSNACKAKGLSYETEQLLVKHHWTGNVRQLKNAIFRAAFIAEKEELTPDCFHFLGFNNQDCLDMRNTLTINFDQEQLDIYEVEVLIAKQALNKFKHNKVHTARFLNISVNKLRRILGEM